MTENRKVGVSFEEAGSAEGLRKASSREGTLRIVSIDALDRSACGGTHVRATGEIGAIAIRRIERVKQHARLEFLCGDRAVRRARADQELLSRLAAHFSASADELPGLVEAQRAELKESATARRELETHLSGLRARELHAAAVPDAGGVRSIVVLEEGPVERLRPLALAIGGIAPGGVRRMDHRAARGAGIHLRRLRRGRGPAAPGRAGAGGRTRRRQRPARTRNRPLSAGAGGGGGGDRSGADLAGIAEMLFRVESICM